MDNFTVFLGGNSVDHSSSNPVRGMKMKNYFPNLSEQEIKSLTIKDVINKITNQHPRKSE